MTKKKQDEWQFFRKLSGRIAYNKKMPALVGSADFQNRGSSVQILCISPDGEMYR